MPLTGDIINAANIHGWDRLAPVGGHLTLRGSSYQLEGRDETFHGSLSLLDSRFDLEGGSFTVDGNVEQVNSFMTIGGGTLTADSYVIEGYSVRSPSKI